MLPSDLLSAVCVLPCVADLFCILPCLTDSCPDPALLSTPMPLLGKTHVCILSLADLRPCAARLGQLELQSV